MRISDWSSDVCSSDLRRARALPAAWHPGGSHQELRRRGDLRQDRGGAVARPAGGDDRAADTLRRRNRPLGRGSPGVDRSATVISRPLRSEEHTSELQSLMRISYAVFCLKKKNTIY